MDLYKKYRENQGTKQTIEDWSKSYRWYLRGWLPTNSDASIIDLGCGEGHLLSALNKFGFTNCQGIDLREDAVAFCKKRGLDAEVCTVQDFFKNSDKKYDVVFAIDVLEHLTLDQSLNLIEEVSKNLKPTGSFIVQVPNLASLFGNSVYYGDITHMHGYSPISLCQLMRSAGFENTELRQAGPGMWSLKSLIRFCFWQLVVSIIRTINLFETGSPGSKIQTRVMLGKFSRNKNEL